MSDVSRACRSAALAFAWGGGQWGKRELASWLVGPYARAVGYAGARSADAAPISGRRDSETTPTVAPEAIARILHEARTELLDSLRRAWSWRYDPTLARDLVAEGVVIGISDHTSAFGYGPVDAPRARLVDRVRSLFFADYLTRPDDYATFAVCPACGAATFDFARSHASECASARIALPPRPPSRPTLHGFDAGSTSSRNRPSCDARGGDPEIEIVGEIEIEIDVEEELSSSSIRQEDVDAFGNLRDTLIDPIEAATFG